MELRQVRAVIAVADHEHFGRAAESLGIGQPALSHAVKSLEDELGVTLLARTTRSVTVTDAGRAFLEQSRTAVALLDAAVQRGRAAGRGEVGSLAVGLLGSALTSPVPKLLREYRRRQPEVTITVDEMTTAQQVDALRNGVIDVGFLRPPLPAPTGEFELVTVTRDRLVAALPADHRLAKNKRLALRSLAGEPFIRTPRDLGVGFYDQITELCRRAGFEPTTVQYATQISSIAGLVAAGFGVSIVPDLRRPVAGVAFVPLTTAASVELALAVPRDRPRSPQVASFVALAATLAARRR